MEEKKQYSKVALDERVLHSFIEEAIQAKLDSSEVVEMVDDMRSNLKRFVVHYNEKYTQLKELTKRLTRDFYEAYTTDFTDTFEKKSEGLQRIEQAIARIKRSVMEPTFDLLGPQVIEASRSAQQLVDLMYQKRMKSEEFHQIVAGFARWHVLDDLQKQLQPPDFASCFAGFGKESRAGHPMENLYELADKKRLRDTLEALYQEKYSMTLARGWVVSKERTKQFLLAFMLSLYRHPLKKLYGKMAAFYRFFSEVCGYTFVKTKETYQKWYRDYQSFVDERTQRAANHPQNEPDKAYKAWKRRERKYQLLEELVEWIRERLCSYDIALA